MKILRHLFLYGLLCFVSFELNASIDDPGLVIKAALEQELKTDYLNKLEEKWGNCGSNPESCLSFETDDSVSLNLPNKELCFPYTRCGFYHCMEKKYRCSDVGVDYFTKLAQPTCNAYVKNINEKKFSKKGVEWIYTVMVCLQKGLINECEVEGRCPTSTENSERERTCRHITEFTLSYHPGCYINSGVGVCRLPMKDKLAIWKTVNPYLTKREREEAYKVVFHCLNPMKKTTFF